MHSAPPRHSSRLRFLVLVLMGLLVSACAPNLRIDATVRVQADVMPVASGGIFLVRIPDARPSGGIVVRRTGAPTFRIPPGHYPPRGMCRVWRAERPPGRQDRPGACSELERRVPPGAYLVYG